MGTSEPGSSEAGGTGVGAEAATGTPEPGSSEAGGTGVVEPSLPNGDETPLAAGLSTPVHDDMNSPILAGSISDFEGGEHDIAPSIPAAMDIGRSPSPEAPAPQPLVGAGNDPALEPSDVDMVGGSHPAPQSGIESPASPLLSEVRCAPATPDQTHEAPAIVASPEHLGVAAPSSPLVPPRAPDVVAPPAMPPPPAMPAMPYRRHKAGISAVEFAKSGNSKCRGCNHKIAYKSVRFEYWWAHNRPPGYLPTECVESLPGDTDLWELIQDLDFLQPEDDAIVAAVSTAKEILQRLLPPV